MSMYLDNASLTSPAWMITGAMARVCQDVSLDKNPPPNMFSEVELESRRRLFWVAYIQERKACLKKARRVILHDRDIEIQLPKAFEGDGSHSLAGEGGGDASNLRLPQEYSGSVVNSTSLTSENSLQVMIAQIHISMLCTSLINVHITDNGGMQDLQRVQELDEKLKKAWDRFPPNLTDLQNLDPLDMGAIRRMPHCPFDASQLTAPALFYLQYCRLLLYRFFTESSDPPLNPDFRTFCLAQSIQVSKISAHLIFRASRNDWFDKCFGLCTEELVHLQTFRAAVILLLVHCTREPALLTVTKEEVEICVRALLSIASFHSQGRRLLDVFDSFARTFGYESGNNNPSQQTNRSSTKSAAPNNANPPTPSPGSAASVAAAVAAAELDSFLPPPPPPSGQRWEFDGQNYAAHSSNNPPQPQGFGNHFVPPSVSEWPDGPGEFRFAGFGSEMEVGRDRDDGVGDVRVDWDAVQQALQFGDTAQGVGGGMSGGGPTQTGYWGF